MKIPLSYLMLNMIIRVFDPCMCEHELVMVGFLILCINVDIYRYIVEISVGDGLLRASK